jgi:hypothetical protein
MRMEEVASPPSESVAVLPTTSTLPVGDATDFDMGYMYLQSEFFVDLCVNVLVRPTRIFRRARSRSQSVTEGPQGRVVPFGGARQGPDRRSRTAVSSADRAESLGL